MAPTLFTGTHFDVSFGTMLLVGLTGNIASGKSAVAQVFADHGVTIVDADDLARRAVETNTRAFRSISDRWGTKVLSADGTLDRAALRRLVFEDPLELEALNEILHPEISRLRDEEVAAALRRGDEIVVCDIPLLFERRLVEDFDRIVLVDAPRPVRLERLVRDRGISETEAMNMIASQMPAELKRARADFVIENRGTKKDLTARADEVWAALERDAHAREPERVLP